MTAERNRRRRARKDDRKDDVQRISRLLDVVHREQVLEERCLDPRSVRAILAGEVCLKCNHPTAHLQMFPQIRRPGIHLSATWADV